MLREQECSKRQTGLSREGGAPGMPMEKRQWQAMEEEGSIRRPAVP